MLLERAMTHSSYANEYNMRANETFEFLGDAILGFLIAENLYLKGPFENEGKLSRKRATIICESSLAQCAGELGIGGMLKLGSNMGGDSARRLNSILSDAMEAVFAAVYIDGGIDAVRGVVMRCLEQTIDSAGTLEKITDNKTRLQEHFYGLDKDVKIVYSIIEETGPAHQRHFISQVAVNGQIMGSGGGGTKKESEQNAAKEALNQIKPYKAPHKTPNKTSHKTQNKTPSKALYKTPNKTTNKTPSKTLNKTQ